MSIKYNHTTHLMSKGGDRQVKERTALIKARGKRTQSEIAALCGVEQQTYSHWERGRSKPSIEKCYCLRKCLVFRRRNFFQTYLTHLMS